MSFKRWRYPARMLALPVAAILISCGDDPVNPGPGPGPSASVGVQDNSFQPGTSTIETGETVTWTWSGSNPHNVTFDDQAVGSSATQVTGSFQRTFGSTGEFTYFCTIHGRAVMSGRVVVQAASAASGGGAGY